MLKRPSYVGWLCCVWTLASVTGCVSRPTISLGTQQATNAADASVMDAARSVIDDAASTAPDHVPDGDDLAMQLANHECEEIEIVCGIDHKDYQNRCQAADAGIAVASRGPCPTGDI